MSKLGSIKGYGDPRAKHRGGAHKLGNQEAGYGYIHSSVFVDGMRGTRSPEEHTQAAEATRSFGQHNDYWEEPTYDVLPSVTDGFPAHSRLDMATYPPYTMSVEHPIVQAMTKEHEKRKAVVKRWPTLEREAIMSGTSRARAVSKWSASKRTRTATQAERETRE